MKNSHRSAFNPFHKISPLALFFGFNLIKTPKRCKIVGFLTDRMNWDRLKEIRKKMQS